MDKILYHTSNFDGPLDLLLHLIKQNKLSINDISISELLEQYLEQIDKMRHHSMDIASEFLEMAARLIHIKTLSLLPKKEEEEKLKKELTDEIMEYEECKKLAQELRGRANFNTFCRETDTLIQQNVLPYNREHTVSELADAILRISFKVTSKNKNPSKDKDIKTIVSRKIVSVYSKVIYIFRKLRNTGICSYNKLFIAGQDRSSNVATFLAILELIKVKRIIVSQNGGQTSISLNKRRR